jgi:hypothetical protein
MLLFTSDLKSFNGKNYRVDFHSNTYIGIDTPIIGGSGSVIYVSEDWTDYLEAGQDLYLYTGDLATGTTLFDAYKARVEADGGVVENDLCTIGFLAERKDGVVVSFTYNSALNRTEITLSGYTYTDQTLVTNNTDSVNSFIPTFSPLLVSLNTQWDTDGTIMDSLMTSYSDITYSNPKDYAYFDRFFDKYRESDDSDMTVAIYLEDALHWAGNVIVDLIEWENTSKPRPYTIRAIDGIDRLKDVFYDGDLLNLGRIKVIDAIKKILAQNALKSFWNDSQDYIRESIEYKSLSVDGWNVSDSILDYTYIPENLFVNKESDKNESEFLTGYDALKGILELFSARIVHCEGAYYIHQIRNYDGGGNFYIRDYNKLDNTYNLTAYDFNNTSLRILGGGKFGYLFGAKKSEIEIKGAKVTSIVGSLGGDLDVNILAGVTKLSKRSLRKSAGIVYYDPEVFYEVGDVKGGVDLGSIMSINFVASSVFGLQFPFVAANRYKLIMRLEITSGDKFIKGGNGIPTYWGEDSITTNRYWDQTIDTYNNPLPVNITFRTPVIPFDLDDCLIRVSFSVVQNVGTTPTTALVFEIDKLTLSIPTASDSNSDSEFVTVENINTKYTKDLILSPLIISETSPLVSASILSVDENYNSSPQSLVNVGTWHGSFDLQGSLSALRVLEAMSLQFRPIEKYMGGVEGFYYPIQTLNYNGKKYAALNILHNYDTDEYSGDWFEVATARTGLSSGTQGGNQGGPLGQQGAEQAPERMIDTFIQQNTVGILSDVLTAGSINTIPFQDFDYDDLRKGDVLYILEPETKLKAGEFVVLTTPNAIDTSISVETITIDYDIPAGCDVVFGYRQTVVAERVRANIFQMKGNATAPDPLTNDYMVNGEFIFIDDFIYWKSGGTYYKVTGVEE